MPVAAGSKQRLTDDTVIIDRIIGDVHNREVIVLDDEIATAGSIVELLKLLRAEGVGRSQWPVLTDCLPARRSNGSSRSRTSPKSSRANTVPLPPGSQLPNMVVLSVAPLFAEAVHRIHEGESISSLFSDELTYG